MGHRRNDVDGFECQVVSSVKQVKIKDMPMIYKEFSASIMRKVADPHRIVEILKDSGYRHMTIWDNFGNDIKDTNSYEAILENADSVPFYVDVLSRA